MGYAEEFRRILTCWDHGVSHSDILQLIIEWCARYKSVTPCLLLVQDILERISDNESAQDIVEDVVQGDCYLELRRALERK